MLGMLVSWHVYAWVDEERPDMMQIRPLPFEGHIKGMYVIVLADCVKQSIFYGPIKKRRIVERS